MKEYLKKLGRTKLQAYLLTSTMNIALLLGYILDVQDIQSKVEAWMPMVNVAVQLIATIAYQWIEGSIDKEAQKQNVYVVDRQPLPSVNPKDLPFDETKTS